MKEKIDELMEADAAAGKPKNPNRVFFEAVGGWKKGTVPGLGSASCLFYDKPTSRCIKANSQYAPSEIASLRESVNEYKSEVQETRTQLEETRAQLEKTREELQEHRKLTADMSKQFQLMSELVRQNCGSLFTPSQFDPEEDGGGDSA